MITCNNWLLTHRGLTPQRLCTSGIQNFALFSPSDKALPEFGLLRVRRIKRLFAFSRAYKRPDKTKRGHKVN